MDDPVAPLRLEPGQPIGPMRLVRQPPPEGAATFAATYVAPAGWGFDPPGDGGIARVTNQLLASAAGPWNRVELARRLDRAGATLHTETSPESAEVTVWGPASGWESLMRVLAEAVLRPRFDPTDVARARRQLLERQLRERTQPASRAHAELMHAIFPADHPYHGTGLGTPRSAARISPGALRRFHRARYGAHDALLVVTAPARLARVERVAQRLFRRLDAAPRSRLAVPRVGTAAHRRIEIDLPGRSQVEVRVGGPSIPQSSPEYPGGYLADQALGGRPLIARLFQSVREQSGLAYGASSHLETLRFGGWWVAGAGTGPDRWRRVVPLVEREVDRIRRRTIPAEELATVRESAIGEIPLGLESTSEAHELAVDAAYHEMPADFWLTWPDRLRELGPAEVLASARRAFDPNRSVTVVVGPLSGR